MPESISKASQQVVKQSPRQGLTSSKREQLLARNKMVVQYQGFVEVVVTRLIRSMGLPVSMKDDFVSAGYVGLVEAAGRFDPARGFDFKTYAYQRIRGAIIDHIRTSCDLKGYMYRKFKAFEAAHELREQSLEGSQPNTGTTTQERSTGALEYLEKVAVGFTLAVQNDDEEVDSPEQEKQDPEKLLEKKREAKKIKEIIATLPEKERTIIEQYYFRDKKFVEIASDFGGYSKSWVSRLHDRALGMLREKITETCHEMAA